MIDYKCCQVISCWHFPFSSDKAVKEKSELFPWDEVAPSATMAAMNGR